jgi:hypothetical protein
MTIDWKIWVPGVVTPLACIVVDYFGPVQILEHVPMAALLCLAAIGIAALVISRTRPTGVASLAMVGPMWIAGAVTLVLGSGLVVIASVGLAQSYRLLLRHPGDAVVIVGWVLLGFTPLWTGLVYLNEARALSRRQAATRGPSRTARVGLAGAAAAIALVLVAHVADTWVMGARAARLDGIPTEASSEAWENALQSIRSYPLCWRRRCLHPVCRRLEARFPTPPGASDGPFVPDHVGAAFARTFEVHIGIGCLS